MTATEQFRPTAAPARAHSFVRPLPCYEPDGPAPPPELPLRPTCLLEPSPVRAMGTLSEAAAQAGAHVMLRLMLEVLDGRRPVGHLVAGVTGPVLRYVVAAVGSLPRTTSMQHTRSGQRTSSGRPTPGARLRSLRVSQPCDDVAEVSAVCQLRGRIRAMAARFELDDGAPLGWRCTAVRLG